MQRLRDSLDRWREWLVLKQEGQLSHSRAAGQLFNRLLGKAWNSWREHHGRMQKARRVSGVRGGAEGGGEAVAAVTFAGFSL